MINVCAGHKNSFDYLILPAKDFGGKSRLTSYEGVGHNSWERTYSDPRDYA